MSKRQTINEIQNRLSHNIERMRAVADSGIAKLVTEAQREVFEGKSESEVESELFEALNSIERQFEDMAASFAQSIEDTVTATLDDGLDVGEPESDWVIDADNKYPQYAGQFGFPPDCPGRGGLHGSPFFNSLKAAISYARKAPVLWTIDSPDDGTTFQVTFCDDTD